MKRWWTYQAERFPLAANGFLILILSISTITHLRLLVGRAGLPSGGVAAVGFASAFLLFLQLRIADEFKDADDDRRHRPERPVPRGLVTLRELGAVSAGCAVAQLAMAAVFGVQAVAGLAVVWGYLGLMSREFFVREWLRRHPFIYMVSHAVIVPLILGYVALLEAIASGVPLPLSGAWFLAMSLFVTMVFEVGRKIRAPHEERDGVETYSAIWGRRDAAFMWSGHVLATSVLASVAAERIGVGAVVQPVLVVGATGALWLAVRIGRLEEGVPGRIVERASALWVILVYVMVGLGPLLWYTWTG